MGGAGRRLRGGLSGRLVRCLPALLILAGLVFDLLTPPGFTGSPFFSAAPLVGAPFYSVRAIVGTGLAAAAVVLGLRLSEHTVGPIESVTELATIVTVVLLALFINRVVRRSGRQLASARGIAEAAQRAVLPMPDERIGGLRIAARYVAAHADARIGGDLYAVQDTPYGVRLIVGDVRGKGLGAVEMVTIALGAFREAAQHEPSLEAVAVRLEHALLREAARRDGHDRFEGFTTAVLAEVPVGAPRLRLLNRGHPAPLLLLPDGTVRDTGPGMPALPLGMGELGERADRAEESPFPDGATLLLYTDGVSEARDENGEFYDVHERLRGRQFPGPDALLDAIVEDVARHTGGAAADDMALLAVTRPGERQPVRRRTVGLTRGSSGDRPISSSHGA